MAAFSTPADSFRFRAPQSPRNESSFSGYNAPLRGGGAAGRLPPPTSASEARAGLQRRFTTDSARFPTMTPIGHSTSQMGNLAEAVDLSSSTYHKVQVLERKRMEYEALKEQRRKIEAKMQMLDQEQESDAQDLRKMSTDYEPGRAPPSAGHAHTGHQSEPTTPPEYRDAGFPSALSRPNRYSTSSITSPPGFPNRAARSGSQLISPLTTISQSQVTSNKLPSKSVPGSRRNSDENEQDSAYEEEPVDHRSAAALNRNSMPATGLNFRTRANVPDLASVLGLGQINTTRFLFGDDDSEKPLRKDQHSTTSPGVKSYLQMNATDDKFPILVRRDDFPGLLSASSAALDLALSQSPGPESQTNGWPTSFNRHRPAQHSLPMNTLPAQSSITQSNGNGTQTPRNQQSSSGAPTTPRNVDRNSLELHYNPFAESNKGSNGAGKPVGSAAQVTPPKLQTSYSANDIPTMKSTNSFVTTPSANSHAQQHFHNHNASLGRIPPNAANKRQSRELSSGDGTVPAARETQSTNFQPAQSSLQPNSPPFGLPTSSPSSSSGVPSAMSPTAATPFSPPGYYGGYNMQMMNMNMNMNGLHLGSPAYPPQNQYSPSPYPVYGYMNRGNDSQARVMQQRRAADSDAANRFANVQLESLTGEIYGLCKDQHGCRYLQKKLEERNPDYIHMIFLETNQHVVELMTDPFGNYLCQKLLELATDDQKTVLTNNAAPQLVKIAMNQHGTRALQKMIEHISTPEQIQTIIYALQDRVVELIQDLNGNHVIQKCLNRLTSEDAQFIFDSVGLHCVVVGTHRHGCCVLQRCIDHASGSQKAKLISQISANAFALVQDPFGNYVVQYILDLNEAAYTEPLIHRFLSQVPALSKQKFSSNVIEKCLRTADSPMKQLLIEEMLQPIELDKMLRDSYANYVIQTAMDFAEPGTKAQLIESIRPVLPSIRSTPYGRRIQGKIQALDGRSGNSSGHITPADNTSPGQIPLSRLVHHQRQTSGTDQSNGAMTPNGTFGNPGIVSPNGSLSNGNAMNAMNAGNTFNQNAFTAGPPMPNVGAQNFGPPLPQPQPQQLQQQPQPQPQQAQQPYIQQPQQMQQPQLPMQNQQPYIHQPQPQQQQHQGLPPMFGRPGTVQQGGPQQNFF
ncbi:MAG: hypothetical protein M4579_002387 [Chaenotheca gracillima]|nr:MAG: hypothetical protein M4579_002387 [Chaenotheca gracillima]